MKKKVDEPDQPASDFDERTQAPSDWQEHLDGVVQKLKQGESIEGYLLSKGTSHKYNDCGIYKIQVKDDSVPKVILGSKQLDRVMAEVNAGQEVKIVFKGTSPTTKGNAMKMFQVFTKK